MSRRTARLLPTVLMAGVAVAGALEPYGAVEGRVVDGDRRPVAGARVVLVEGGNAGPQRTTESGDDGRFGLRGVWPGRYRLEVDAPGHQWVEVRDLEVEPGRTAVLSIVARATDADEIVLLTGSPTVDATSHRLEPPVESAWSPRQRWWLALPATAPDASDGAGPDDVSFLGAPSADRSRSVGGGPAPPRVRDLAEPTPPGAPSRSAVLGGLPSAALGALGGGAVVVVPRGGEGHGSLSVEHLDDAFAGAGARAPLGRAGWRGPASVSSLGAAHGGRLRGERAWGFVALEGVLGRERRLARPGGRRAATEDLVDARGVDWLASLDWQADARHRLHLTSSGRLETTDGALSTVDRLPASADGVTDTRYDAELRAFDVVASWLAVPSERLLVDVRAGLARTDAELRPASDLPTVVDATGDGRLSGGVGHGVAVGGAGFPEHRDSHRSATVRLGVAADVHRDHRLEAALELRTRRTVRRLQTAAAAGFPCVAPAGAAAGCGAGADGVAVDWVAGTRVLAYDDEWWIVDPPEGSVGGRAEDWTVELVDRWRPAAAWSVSAGLRAGRWSVRSDGSAATAAGRELRFGVEDTLGGFVGWAWDFEGRGRSRLYGQLGRSRRPLPLDPDAGLLVRADPTVVRTDGRGSVVDVIGPPVVVVDPALEPGRLDEAVLGVEYEVLAGLLVGAAGVVRRLEGSPSAVTLDGGRSWWLRGDGGTVVADPVTGAALDRPLELAEPRRHLEMAVLYGHRRWAGGWQLGLWLAWSRLEGAVEGDRLPGLRRLDDPSLESPLTPAAGDVVGPLANDRRWQGRVTGAARLGRGLTLGGTVWAATGAPVSRVGALAPPLGLDQRTVDGRGDAGRTPTLWRIDAQLVWEVPALGPAELWLEARNLLDDQTAVAADPRWTLDPPGSGGRVEPRWGEPAIRQPPRTVSIGARWSW